MPLAMAVVAVPSSMGGWFDFAWRARDFQSISILSILTIGLTILAAYCWGGDSVIRSRRFSLLYVPILAIVTLSVMKWRLNDWVKVIHHLPHSQPMPWSGLLLPAILLACSEVVVVELVGFWKRNPQARTRPSADVSVGPVR
jgi:phosphoglycerol transferase MdoB-like AlkP superfamily enzyme